MIMLRNIIYGSALLLAIVLALWLIPLWQTLGLEVESGAERLFLETEARKAVALVLLCGLLLIGLGFLWRHLAFGQKRTEQLELDARKANEELLQLSRESLRVAQETLALGRDGERTDRYLRAVEQLAGEKAQARLGAVFALERIARESANEHWPIMQVLAAHVRAHAAWRGDEPDELSEMDMEEERQTPALAPDVQAALTVIGRRSLECARNEEESLDLSGADLRGADLRGALLKGVDFERTRLARADLEGACLEGARLTLARLEGAHLLRANLRGADLTLSRLTGAHLWEADLSGAELAMAQLHNADFWKTKLYGAQLSRAIGMTKRQLDASLVDQTTSLPQFFLTPESKSRLA
jgi:uncharacterized protein YjbI with pentapeptide repeats